MSIKRAICLVWTFGWMDRRTDHNYRKASLLVIKADSKLLVLSLINQLYAFLVVNNLKKIIKKHHFRTN